MPYCDDNDGWSDYYPDPWDEIPLDRVATDYDGKTELLALVPDKKTQGKYVTSVPARANGSGRCIVFVNGLRPEDGVQEGESVWLALTELPKKDKNGRRMYSAVPARDHYEAVTMWVPSTDNPDTFWKVRGITNWRGRLVRTEDELLGVRSRVIELARETHLVDGWIDWEKMVVNTKSTMTIAVSTMTQLPSGSWTPVESRRYEAEDRADTIVAVRFADNKWPYADLYPAPTAAGRVKLLVQTSSGKDFVLDDLGSTSWCNLPKSVQRELEEAYPLCRVCARVRHPKDEPHCTDGGPVPASAASLQALATRFGGGA